MVEAHPYFIDAICQTAWKDYELRIGIIYHDDIPVAAQIWFVGNFTAYIFKLAYREPYEKTSVGSILTADMIDHVIGKDRVNCIDLLTGDDHYKKYWMSSNHPLMGVQACTKESWTGKAYGIMNILSDLKKRVSTYFLMNKI